MSNKGLFRHTKIGRIIWKLISPGKKLHKNYLPLLFTSHRAKEGKSDMEKNGKYL